MCTVLKSVVYLEYMKDKSVQPPILACRYNSIFLKVFLCCHPLPSSLCRVFIRSAQQFVHGIIPASNLAADRHNLDDVVGSISREMGFTIPFRKASSQSAVEDKLLRVDEVCVVCVRVCVHACTSCVCAHV